VMEYADGGTLRNYLKDHSDNLTWNDKLNLGFQLVNAVLCLHNEGIVHRDLVICLHYIDYVNFIIVCIINCLIIL
jgi:serine/threonine protein kinase